MPGDTSVAATADGRDPSAANDPIIPDKQNLT